MNKYYSSIITDEFYKRINEIKNGKGFINNTLKHKILNYTFIFVDTKSCTSVFIEEKELSLKEIKNFNITNVIVLLNTETKYAGHWNHNYIFIGIFDKNSNESLIEFESIGINSFETTSLFSRGYYNRDIICKYNIELIKNPFTKYINDVLKPIKKAINSNFLNQYNSLSLQPFGIDKKHISLPIDTKSILTMKYQLPKDFDVFLNDIKQFDTNFTKNLFKNDGRTRFNPNDYVK